MIDNCGEVVDRERIKTTLFEAADISEMYAEPNTWDVYECAVDEIIRHNSKHFDDPLDEDEMTRLSLDGIRAQVAGLSIVHEPNLFLASVFDRATISHLCMALGSTTV